MKHALRSITRVALVTSALLLVLATAGAAPVVLMEDWTRDPVGHRGLPTGWTGESFGRRADFDFVIAEHAGQRVLHMNSRDEHSTIAKEITGTVRLKETPILEWIWSVQTLPSGGGVRRKETTDIAAQLYVVWPRRPAVLRSRIIGYIWDATAPAGSIVKSKKTPTAGGGPHGAPAAESGRRRRAGRRRPRAGRDGRAGSGLQPRPASDTITEVAHGDLPRWHAALVNDTR